MMSLYQEADNFVLTRLRCLIEPRKDKCNTGDFWFNVLNYVIHDFVSYR